jgi:hypothetical protein
MNDDSALYIHCQKDSPMGAREWWNELDKSFGANKITIEWEEIWEDEEGHSCKLFLEMKVDTLKKASNLVGAFLLGLKTHKDFSQKYYSINKSIENYKSLRGVPSDFRLVSTRVRLIDGICD